MDATLTGQVAPSRRKELSTSGVRPAQRHHSRRNPCPVCSGGNDLPNGGGVRCWGFGSEDRRLAICTRLESGRPAGDSGGWLHRIGGPCDCGSAHDVGAPPPTLGFNADRLRRPTAASARDSSNGRDWPAAIWRATDWAPRTIVERYLASRGLSGPIPPSIRFHPSLRHPSGRRFPALVAAVTAWPGRELVAIHRTFLCPDGGAKASVHPNRMLLGPVRGGTVWLSPPAASLAISEGIETGLSVQLATGIPTWAALSASNMPAAMLPPLPLASEVIVAADADPAGLAAASAAADRWTVEGRRVRIAVPPAGRDFNDLLQGTP